VALRVIIRKFKGRDIDKLVKEANPAVVPDTAERGFRIEHISQFLDRINADSLRLAVNVVADTLKSLAVSTPTLRDCHIRAKYNEKDNGYRAFHFDVTPAQESLDFLPFEIQLKTSEWHEIAEHGTAMHCYYIGGNKEFVDMVKAAYQEILHRSYDERREAPSHPAPALRSQTS
jgi:ppGpp synthetase/RelA/SpoT-type nucleotidyltranferase